MSSIETIFLEALVPVFFGLGLGYYAGRRGRVDNRNVAALNTTLMHFILPCSLFLGISRTSAVVLRSQLSLLVIMGIAMIAIYALVFFLARKAFRKSASEASIQALTVSFPNNVAVGFPVLSSFFGAAGLLAVAAAIVAAVFVISPITLVLLECNADPEKCAQPLFKRLGPALLSSFRRPVVLAPICALIFPITGHVLPASVAPALDLVGKATIGLALFLTGLILSAQPVKISRGVACGVLLKNIAQPALVLLLVLLFHQHGEIAREAILLAAVPAGFFGTVFGSRYCVSSADASSTLFFSTLASIITLPIVIVLIGHLR
jgi:malonate transporter and related proteins